MKIRITKEFTFEMAHALTGHDGPCKNIHGHSYVLAITVAGEPVQDLNDPKNGMVLDFAILKQLVRHEITEPFDHSLVLNIAHKEAYTGIQEKQNKLIWVNYQPTCENLLQDFTLRIKDRLPKEIQLHSIRLRETATSYAEWHAADNE